jgi:WD40 repeat protein
MAAFRSQIIILALFLLSATFAAGAQPPQPKADERKPKTDFYGDPLPPGAIARCGTMRLRHSNPRDGLDAAFAPDGKTFATKDADALRLWETKTGKLLWELAEKQGPQMRFAKDGKYIAVQGERGTVCVVDAATGKLRRRFSAGSSLIDLSPDGKQLAISEGNDEVTFWDPASGKRLLALGSRLRQLVGGVFSADATLFVTISDGGMICSWDTATGKLVQRLENALPKVRHSLLSQDGLLVAVMPWENGPISLWDSKTGEKRCALQQDEKEFRAPRYFSRDSRTLVTNQRSPNGEDTVVSLWETGTGKLVRRLTFPEPHADVAVLSPDEQTLLTHNDGIVHLWDAVTGKPRFQYPGHERIVWSLAFTRNENRLVSGAQDGDIRIWDAATGKSELAIKSHKWGVLSFALSQDDKAVLSGGYDGTVRLHELATAKQLWRFDIGRPPEESKLFRVFVPQVGISSDGQSAVAFSWDGIDQSASIRVLDAATGKPLNRRSIDFIPFRNAKILPCARFIAGIRSFIPGPGVSPADSKALEQQRDTSVVLLQEITSGREVFSVRLPDFSGPYHSFTPDGRMLVVTTRELSPAEEYRTKKTTLRLVESASGKERLAIDLPVEGSGFNLSRAVTVSNDCRTLAASRTDGIIQVWDIPSGKELLRRNGYASHAEVLAFTPNGKSLASGHQDGTILIWDLSPEIDHRPQPLKADAKRIEQWWTALAGDDAKQAHVAIWGLIGTPEQTLSLLRDRLRPAEMPPAEKIKQLISDLDSEEFAKRSAANKELAEFEELAEPPMREALKEDISAEKRKRLENLLDITLIVRTPEKLRQLRALEVLEQIGTPEARQFLAKLSKGIPEARLTRDAKAALQRLERR